MVRACEGMEECRIPKVVVEWQPEERRRRGSLGKSGLNVYRGAWTSMAFNSKMLKIEKSGESRLK